jgi:hypothetical protein
MVVKGLLSLDLTRCEYKCSKCQKLKNILKFIKWKGMRKQHNVENRNEFVRCVLS